MTTDATGPVHRSPNLLAVAVVHAVLVVVGAIAVPAIAAGGQPMPSPLGDPAAGAPYFAAHAFAIQLSALLSLGAAIPLGIFAATATSRIQFLGGRAAGIQIAMFGGVAASVLLAISAAVLWVTPQTPDPALVHALHLIMFAVGGPACVAAQGLLIAGVAITAALHGFVHRGWMVAGIAIALVAELSILVLVVPALALLLPLARFSGLIWMIGIAAVLPRARPPGGPP
jgi:hypothetical protein